MMKQDFLAIYKMKKKRIRNNHTYSASHFPCPPFEGTSHLAFLQLEMDFLVGNNIDLLPSYEKMHKVPNLHINLHKNILYLDFTYLSTTQPISKGNLNN